MYILVNENHIVEHISSKQPFAYSDNLILCEVESLPQSYDYLVAENIREKTDTWQQAVEDYDDNGGVVSKTEERSRTYFTCDLVARLRPQPSQEQIEKRKHEQYKDLCKKYIRQKYSLEKENQINREYLAYLTESEIARPEAKLNFLEYHTYVEQCLLKAQQESK